MAFGVYEDISGRRYGKLVVICRSSVCRSGDIRWKCKCDCGREHHVLGGHLKAGSTKSCGCDRPFGPTHKQWKGCGEISGDFWCSIKRGAAGDKGRRYPVPFEISIEYAWDLFVKQGYKCAITNLPISMGRKYANESRTASLDRIDNSLGYVSGNVQWVHRDINMMKGQFDQQYFIGMCKAVASNCAGGACQI